jgi:cytochrome c-type biogenesis protein CcmH/NrfG
VPPSIQPGNDVNNNIIEVLVTVASFLHPDAETVDSLSPRERARWTKFQDAVVKGHYSITDLMKLLKEVVREQHEADLGDKKQKRRERQKLFDQRLSELKTNYEESREERKRVLDLITLCVVALILCAFLTATFAQSWILPGAGACTALVAVIAVLTRLRAQITKGDPSHGLF